MKLLKEILIVFILLILTTVTYQHISYPKRLKNALQREIAINFGVQSRVGTVKVNFFAGEVKVKNTLIKNPYEDFKEQFFMEIPGIYVKLSPLAFFKKNIVLDEVVIYSPTMYLENNSEEKTNFSTIQQNALHYKAARTKRYFTIRDLEVRDFEILRVDEPSKAHNVEEIIVKNIGAQESGLNCSKISVKLLDIASKRALKQYKYDTSSGGLLKIVDAKRQARSLEKLDEKTCVGETKNEAESLDIIRDEVQLKEVESIIEESNEEVKELEGALGV